MTIRDLSEANDFILGMGNRNSSQIPVVYKQETQEVVIDKNGKLSDRKKRYSEGKDIVFKCKNCSDYIGKGKETGEEEDKGKIFCFKCNDYHEYSNAIIWSKDRLWYKPSELENRKKYEELMNKYLENNQPIIREI